MTGAELRTLRESHGLTQRGLAQLLGYHEKHIGRMEREEDGVSITQRCCNLLKSLLKKKRVNKDTPSH